MKIKDIILEDKENTGYQGAKDIQDHLDGHNTPKNDPYKMDKDADAVHPQEVFKARDVGGYDRVYHMNRLMMAMAKSDGKSTKPTDSASEAWYEKYNTIHPYTEEEYNMFVGATKTIPTDKKTVVPYSKSQEPEDTNTKSLVVGFKGFSGEKKSKKK